MKTEMGEYIVGACLKLIKECDFVEYNVRRPGGGIAGLNELDVLGLDFKSGTVYLCEVTTHLDGLLYTNSRITIETVKKKYKKQREYAESHLSGFPSRHYMFWSPVVSAGIARELEKIEGLELVINSNYASYIGLLQEFAKRVTYDTGNPAVRILQILGHLRKSNVS